MTTDTMQVPKLESSHVVSRTDGDSLLRGIRAHDPDALSEIYDRFSGIVYSAALRILREPTTAEDVLQEVFLHLWRNPDSYGSDRSPLWASLVLDARNRSIAVLRSQDPKDWNNTFEDIALASNANYTDLAEPECMAVKVREAMAVMPAEWRRALDLAYFEGRTCSEIAESTGDSLETVKAYIHSALLALRKVL